MSSLGGMSGPFSRRADGHCARCAATTSATWPWPGWRTLRKVWLAIVFVLVVLSPLYLADIHGILPAVMIFVIGIGPLNSLAAIQPTCLTCGGVVDPLPLPLTAAVSEPAAAASAEAEPSIRPPAV